MTENTYYCGLCRRKVPLSTWPHPHTELDDFAGDDYYDEVRHRKEMEEAESTDSPGYEELDDEEVARQEEYLRKAGYPEIDTPINLSAISLAKPEPQEPTLVKCPWCPSHHVKGTEHLCPFNPDRPPGW